MRERCDADTDTFGNAQCRSGVGPADVLGPADVVDSFAFRYTDADARCDRTVCPCPAAPDDGASCTISGRLVLSAYQWGKVLRAR